MDPDVATILASWSPVDFVHPAVQRERVREARSALPPFVPRHGVRIEDAAVPRPDGDPVPIRVHRPAAPDSSRGTLVWIHGGAYCIGAADHEDLICSELSGRTGSTVVSVDYRLAPEHPFPAGFHDCVHVVEQVAAGALTGVPSDRVAVGGTSAGAGLAAAVALDARDRSGPDLAFQLLLYPFIDDRRQGASFSTAADAIVFNAEDARIAWDHYLGTDRDEVPAYAAPTRATDVANLPAAYVLAAGLDCLRDDAVDQAVRMMRAGVDVELHVVPDVPHGFMSLAPTTPVAEATMNEIVRALDRALEG